MSRTSNDCPVCGIRTFARWHCGIDISSSRPFRMGAPELKAVHTLAMATKGLDEETYRLRLGAAGVASSKQFTRRQFVDFMRALRALPDAPTWRAQGGM